MSERKKGVNSNPIKGSNRSKKRMNRKFISLVASSRKHRRAERRLGVSRVAKPNPQSEHQQHVGGSVNYH